MLPDELVQERAKLLARLSVMMRWSWAVQGV